VSGSRRGPSQEGGRQTLASRFATFASLNRIPQTHARTARRSAGSSSSARASQHSRSRCRRARRWRCSWRCRATCTNDRVLCTRLSTWGAFVSALGTLNCDCIWVRCCCGRRVRRRPRGAKPAPKNGCLGLPPLPSSLPAPSPSCRRVGRPVRLLFLGAILSEISSFLSPGKRIHHQRSSRHAKDPLKFGISRGAAAACSPTRVRTNS
jgi:hypothetical protein